MDGYLVIEVHLVELVDTADSIIRQHQCSSFDPHIARLISGDTGGQPSRTCGLAVRVDTPRHKLIDSLKELRLRGGRVTNNQDIDIASDGDLVGSCNLMDASKKLQKQCFLYFRLSVHGGEQAVSKIIVQIRILLDPFDGEDLFLGQMREDPLQDHGFVESLLASLIVLIVEIIFVIVFWTLFFPELVVLHN